MFGDPGSAAPARPERVRALAPFAVVATVIVAVLALLLIGGGFDEPRLRGAASRPTTATTPSSTSPPSTGPASSGAVPGAPSTTALGTTAPEITAPEITAPGSTAPAPTETALSPLAAKETQVATARRGRDSIAIHDGPGGAQVRRVANPGEYGQDQVFVVIGRRPGWLQVQLPVRPNGSTGWIRADDVSVAGHDYQIHVSLSGYRMQVQKGAEVVLDTPVGVGTSDTPTPGGLAYTWVLLAPTNSGYGAYAYGLSGFSEVLERFGGSDARLGIHGTDDASSIGRDVSHGCVRVPDAAIVRLVEEIRLPLGVPVVIDA